MLTATQARRRRIADSLTLPLAMQLELASSNAVAAEYQVLTGVSVLAGTARGSLSPRRATRIILVGVHSSMHHNLAMTYLMLCCQAASSNSTSLTGSCVLVHRPANAMLCLTEVD